MNIIQLLYFIPYLIVYKFDFKNRPSKQGLYNVLFGDKKNK